MNMRGIATLVFYLIIFSVSAQTERCGFINKTDPGRFEAWLSSRQATGRTQQAILYQIPVVVHVFHNGDALGTGYNFPSDRITSQIKTLNEDFRRMQGRPGFNNHPDGGDALIEFVLAQRDPEGNPTDGIVRVDMTSVHPDPQPGDVITLCSTYSYWDPNQYLNLWCLPTGLPPGLLLGSGRFPVTDLKGLDDLDTQPDGDGVFINALNFGSGDTLNDPNYNMGRTLTHEIGHFLGLLHTWGSINNSRHCDAYTDYCDDTPPTPEATAQCPAIQPTACDGRKVLIENYMDGSYDACMNIFTRNQISRMRIVLENSPRRKSLTTSPAIDRSVVAGVDDDPEPFITVYPNPTTERAYISVAMSELNIDIAGYSMLGQMLFRWDQVAMNADRELPINGRHGETIIIVVRARGKSYRYLLEIR